MHVETNLRKNIMSKLSKIVSEFSKHYRKNLCLYNFYIKSASIYIVRHVSLPKRRNASDVGISYAVAMLIASR